MSKRKRPPIVPLRAEALSITWNRTGYRGVDEGRPGRFRAVVGGGKWRSRYFDTATAAARAYDREARRRYGKLAAFNFPRRGERKVVLMDTDVCLRGHDRARFTHFTPDGRAGYCRKCNALSQARSHARMLTASARR